MKKRCFALVLAASMILTLLAGCGTKQESTKAESSSAAETEKETAEETETADVVNHANKEGLPIADEEITLVVGVNAGNASYQGPWEDLDWVKQLQEAAGVKLEFRVYNTDEDINLMFTSRDYPDISFKVGSDKQITEAALGGDVLALDDLIQEWSPNWSKFLAEDSVAKKTITADDGHIYSLPLIRNESYLAGLRDQWVINKVWLDELGLEVPTTTEEFYQVLKAFKENAGKGSIPENVIPYACCGITNNVGGVLDVIGSFGIRVSGENYMVTVDDDGKVEFNYVNEDIKEALLYLRKLYEEELIPYECLTDDFSTFMTKAKSDPAMVGSYPIRINPDPYNETIVPMGPLDSGNGKTPLMRRQTNRITRNYFTIYSTCEYPEVAMRLADLIAEPDWSIQAMYGMFGDTYVEKTGEKSYIVKAYPGDAQGATSAPQNRVPFLIDQEMADNLVFEPGSSAAQIQGAIDEVYKDNRPSEANLYPLVMFDTEQTTKLAELKKDLLDYMNNTFATWMLNGGIEEGWDEYVKQMEKTGCRGIYHHFAGRPGCF